ncbi:MAG TPA: DoxX family protein, partial [Archangium sp.]|nr:DoxX family protein [Archangium sp.]
MMNTQGAAIGWTLVRVVFGLTLALGHGLPKVTGDISRFAEGVAALGFPFPTFFAWCATLTEAVGGVLIAVGLFTRPAAALAAFTMIVAAFRHRPDPFSLMEKPLLFLTVFVALSIAG